MTLDQSDATQVLALCEASGDERASAHIRTIIEDTGLPASVKAAFFQDLRAALEDPAGRQATPWTVIRRFMDGPGRKYVAQGEETGETVSLRDAPSYLRDILRLALREAVSRVLLVPSGTALYRGPTLHLVAPAAGELFPELLQYCRAVADLADGQQEASCAVEPDGTLSPAGAAGTPARLQSVSNGRVSGLQLLF